MAEVAHTDNAEEWRDVVGYEGLYQVSSLGRVKSLERDVSRGRKGIRRFPEKIMRQNPRGGYPSVELAKSGVPKMKLVHRLVCEAWHGPSPSGEHQAAHADGTKNNNRPSNLRWATRVENAQDRTLHGRNQIGLLNVNTRLTPGQIIEIRNRHSMGESVRSIALLYPCSATNIANIVARRIWKHI